MGEHRRLKPTMASRKLQALDFIKRYFAAYGDSPSLAEIGAELGVSRQHASDLVHQLAVDQMIRHVAGKRRGIRLIDRKEEISEADALVILARQGWIVNDAGLTKSGLPMLPELDHDPGSGSGTGTVDHGEFAG
ncbi:MAG TPA: hypothetical protein VGB54_11155 [Allosphingosinicella sp.]